MCNLCILADTAAEFLLGVAKFRYRQACLFLSVKGLEFELDALHSIEKPSYLLCHHIMTIYGQALPSYPGYHAKDLSDSEE
jgi:hypothetical protein